MQVGVFAKTFPGDHPTNVLMASKAAGFNSVQYNMSCSGLESLPATIANKTAREVQRAAAASSIQIVAVSATYNMTDPDLERRQSGRRGFKAIAENAEQMGSNLLTVCSGSMDPNDKWKRHRANDDPETWIEMCREFEKILSYAEQYNILIGVEPEHANVVSSSHKAQRLLHEFPGSRIRIVFDPANILEDVPQENQQQTIDEALDLLGPKITLAHAKDRDLEGEVVPAGVGFIDWDHVLRGLSNIGFDGPLIAHGISAKDAPQVAKFLAQQIARL